MNENVTPAIIALLGVLLSIIASLFVSIRQYRTESQKIRSEYLHLYAGKLFDRRMDKYPIIFEAMLAIVQKINLNQPISLEELERLGDQFLDWNQKYSSLLSTHSEHIIHKLYIHLNNMTQQERETLIASPLLLKELENRLLEFYLALKGDLGIYALVSPTVITDFMTPKSIDEVAKLSGIASKVQES